MGSSSFWDKESDEILLSKMERSKNFTDVFKEVADFFGITWYNARSHWYSKRFQQKYSERIAKIDHRSEPYNVMSRKEKERADRTNSIKELKARQDEDIRRQYEALEKEEQEQERLQSESQSNASQSESQSNASQSNANQTQFKLKASDINSEVAAAAVGIIDNANLVTMPNINSNNTPALISTDKILEDTKATFSNLVEIISFLSDVRNREDAYLSRISELEERCKALVADNQQVYNQYNDILKVINEARKLVYTADVPKTFKIKDGAVEMD